jgi:hypothetical protein
MGDSLKQSKIMSLIEAFVSILVGFGISMAAQATFLPLLGLEISLRQNFIFALIMTVISIARQYGMRRIFEALHIRRALSPFMQAVISERYRQIESEGWSHEHDDFHERGELAKAASHYAFYAGEDVPMPSTWPWDRSWWKPQNFRRDLVRAGALILAEGERFDRLKTRPAHKRSQWEAMSEALEPRKPAA